MIKNQIAQDEIISRLKNWARWARQPVGPESYPQINPAFKNAPMLKWHEDGWGDKDAAPEEIEPPVDELDAIKIEYSLIKLKIIYKKAIIDEFLIRAKKYGANHKKNLRLAIFNLHI